MDLKSIPQEDRADFEKRLSKLGVDAASIEDETLEIEPGKSLRLEMAGESPISPMIFETRDLDTLRKWIGTPEKVATQRTVQPFETIFNGPDFVEKSLATRDNEEKVTHSTIRKRRTKSAKGLISHSGLSLEQISKVDPSLLLESVQRSKAGSTAIRLKSKEVETLRVAARNYIHGDIKTVQSFKPAIEAFFDSFQVAVWIKTRIVVKKNSTLSMGTGVHNLTAYELIIEPGGRIRSHGHLAVSVTKIRKPVTINPGVLLPNHVLTVNTLPRDPLFP